MKPPGFWFDPAAAPGWQARTLAPLSWAFARATAARVARASRYHPRVPVICVGNLNLGGSGKTPAVIALVEHYTQLGRAVHVVSRGHGGTIDGPVEVDAQRHDAGQVGDEPHLLAAFASTWVAKDRAAGVAAAEAAGAQVIVMDDGHQNPDVAKRLSIVVVDAEIGFGNGRVFPAGPLRESVKVGCMRADAVLAVGDASAQARIMAEWGDLIRCPVLGARLEVLPLGIDWRDTRVVAFAGIGRPEKFFDTLRRLGAQVVETVALDDHQSLRPALLSRLKASAVQSDAQLVTTEKDAARLPSRFRQDVLTLPVRLCFDDPAALTAVLP